VIFNLAFYESLFFESSSVLDNELHVDLMLNPMLSYWTADEWAHFHYFQTYKNLSKAIWLSDHIDYTISRYRSWIRRAYDIVAAIYRTISCTNARLARALLTHRIGGVWLMSLAVHTVHGSLWLTFPVVDLSCSALGAWGGDGSRTSGGLNYACRKAHCARLTA